MTVSPIATQRLFFRMFLALICAMALPFAASCGGSGGATPATPATPTAPADTIALTLGSTSSTAPQGGSIQRVSATIARSSSTSSVTLTVSGLPSGATYTVDSQPGTGTSGVIALNPGTAAAGAYSLTVSASDGTATGAAALSFNISASVITTSFSTPITWSSSDALISPIANATHPIISVKDPTVVRYNNQWLVYATTADTKGGWNMVYLNFADWNSAASAQPYYMDATAGLSGYHCAPQLYYFTPQKKWYLIYQSGPPQYSTNDDPTQPANWTAPASFFSSQPSTVANWIDFWTICDAKNCYLFFEGDDGKVYRSSTSISDFPHNFTTPQIILQAASAGDLFEASNVYYLKGLNQYLMLIEAMSPADGHRYFRAFVANTLDGDFAPLANANSYTAPFLGEANVTFASGNAWTKDFSHGEMIRTGYDETMTIDPAKLQYLYQGDDPNATSKDYSQAPYKLGLVTRSN